MEIKRKLASIQKVLSVDPIPKSDFIEKITVLGWECVAKKGEFKAGDLCVYFEIDSILPENPVFEFMEDRKYRVKTARFRKQIAQGLALPIKTIMPAFDTPRMIDKYREGDDVTDVIGVIKYVAPEKGPSNQKRKQRHPVIRWMMQFAWFRVIYFFFIPKRTKGNFPEFIPKTDEPRIQSRPSILWKNMDKEFYITEKLDGTSCTIFYNSELDKTNRFGIPVDKGRGFGVCSRNLRLLHEDDSYWWEIVKNFNIREKLVQFCKDSNRSLAIQGEIIGSAIQKNKYKFEQNKRVFRVFNIWDIDKQEYVPFDQRTCLCEALDLVSVPYLGTFIIQDGMEVKELIELSTRFSVYNKQTIAEGIVCRQMENENISFKVINPKFLLKHDE